MQTKTLAVTHCARCHNTHRALTFYPVPHGATHWGVCPDTQGILFSAPDEKRGGGAGGVTPASKAEGVVRQCCYIDYGTERQCALPAEFVVRWGRLPHEYSEGCGRHAVGLVPDILSFDDVTIETIESDTVRAESVPVEIDER